MMIPDKQLLTELKHLSEALAPTEDLSKTSFLIDVREEFKPRPLLLLELIVGKVDDPLDVLVEAGPDILVHAILLKPSGHLSS